MSSLTAKSRWGKRFEDCLLMFGTVCGVRREVRSEKYSFSTEEIITWCSLWKHLLQDWEETSRHLSINTCHPSAGPLTRHCRAPRTSAREREFPVAWRRRCPSLVCGERSAAPPSSSWSACQGGLSQKATHNELRQESCYRKWRLLSNTCLGHVTGKCIHFVS